MMSAADNENLKREMRKMKNRESAERNRKEKNNSIEMLQGKVLKLCSDIHSVAVDNWYTRRSMNFEKEPFPVYMAPILEPAEF